MPLVSGRPSGQWWRFDASSGHCLAASDAGSDARRQTPDALRLTFDDVFGANSEPLWAAIMEAGSSGAPYACLGALPTDGGAQGPARIGHVIFDRSTPAICDFLLVAITESTSLSGAAADRLGTFMSASTEGIAFHVDGIITDVNPSLLRMLGYDAAQMIGHRTIEFVPPAEHARVLAAIASGRDVAYESFAVRANGEIIPVEYRAATVTWRDQVQRVILVRDLTEQRKAEERTRHQALHDALTGLPNRAHLDQRLAEMTSASSAGAAAFALVFFDLDQLKRINDSLGHGMGDQLLVAIAERLILFCEYEAEVMGRCWIARIGGDEFVILVESTDPARLIPFCDRLQDTLHAPTHLPGHGSVQVTASIGVALHPEHGSTPSALLRHADLAMYAAKEAGRARTRLFDRSLAATAEAALALESEVATAIRNHDFELHFQPIFRMSDGVLRGAEALLRWRHPGRGMLGPNEFIGIAERVFMLLPISDWVFDEALRQVARWRRTGWADARVAINLATAEVRHSPMARRIQSALARHGLPGNALELEVTEALLLQDEIALLAPLAELRQAGVEVAIDDFGTGYSALARLRTLPVDRIKIDRSFIEPMIHDRGAHRLVESMLHLARSMNLRSTAEGVEHAAQLQALREIACDEAQGFHLSAPLPANAFCEKLPAWLALRARQDAPSRG